MKKPWNSIWYLTGRKAFSRSHRGSWTGITEVTIASVLTVSGVVMLVGFLTANMLSPAVTDLSSWVLDYLLKPIISLAISGIGAYMMVKAAWKVGASAERRGALVSRANQLDLLNDVRRRRGDLPNVPTASSGPFKGQSLPFQILASRQSLWGLVTAGILCLVFVIIVVVLVVTAYVKFSIGRPDWVAGGVAIPTMFAATWSFYRFLKQLLKLTSLGPTVVELSSYPIVPGAINQVVVSQTGRSRLNLLDVNLICMEEATFNQGTNTLTKRNLVFSRRLFRKRGIKFDGRPFHAEFTFALPIGAMHSFQSSSNRVTWQIEIRGQAKGFPRVVRSFEIIVIPRGIELPNQLARAK